MSRYTLPCGCGYELVEDGSVQRIREFHDPGCDGRPPAIYAADHDHPISEPCWAGCPARR